ncbi:MAG TPA: septal ring lytic transglycosylase RlpA family protein [Candidatus Limnocylindria bacterium]|nr:septal ring lytic transglycosylase RlpA family protein [Candidatus Limnocylindria bacterium]
MRKAGVLVALVLALAAAALPQGGARAATCTSFTGPGIAAPARVPSGLPGFHAAWYGQSGYMSLCPGERATATVAYYNSGSRGWIASRMGEAAYLGTWEPEPGQDRASVLGGDGTGGSPATGWPRANRLAQQPAAYVGPNQVAWFQFTVQAPLVAGTYRIALRPVIEGAQWMEDYGVFWVVTVLNADGTPPPQATPAPTPTVTTVLASYFGPGLYGNRTACGLTLTTTLEGVAHRTLPCGSPVRLAHAGREVTVPVVDRGPQIAGREFDLTYATKNALACPDLCTLQWIR